MADAAVLTHNNLSLLDSVEEEQKKDNLELQQVLATFAVTTVLAKKIADYNHPLSQRQRLFNKWQTGLLQHITSTPKLGKEFQTPPKPKRKLFEKQQDYEARLSAYQQTVQPIIKRQEALARLTDRLMAVGRDNLFSTSAELDSFIQNLVESSPELRGLGLDEAIISFRQQQAERFAAKNQRINQSPWMRRNLASVRAGEDATYLGKLHEAEYQRWLQASSRNPQESVGRGTLRQGRRVVQKNVRLQDLAAVQRDFVQELIFAELSKGNTDGLMDTVLAAYRRGAATRFKEHLGITLSAEQLAEMDKLVIGLTQRYLNFASFRQRVEETHRDKQQSKSPDISQIQSAQQKIKQIQELPQKLQELNIRLQEFAKTAQQALESFGKFMSENLPRLGEGVLNVFSKVGSFLGGGGGGVVAGGGGAAAIGGGTVATGATVAAGTAAGGGAAAAGGAAVAAGGVAAVATSEVWVPILIIALVVILLIIIFVLAAVFILNSGSVTKPARFGNTTFEVSSTTSTNFDSSSVLALLPDPLPPLTDSARGYENSVRSNCLPNQEVYNTVGQNTGLPWQVLAGIHYIEGGCRANASLVSGRTIGNIEPDVGLNCTTTQSAPGDPIVIVTDSGETGCGFTSLENSAYYAANHLKGKIGGRAPSNYQELASALERYNGLGNRNCRPSVLNQLPSPPPYCPPEFPGDDHIYPMNYFDQKHETMYLVYCADHTPCSPPRVYRRPGVLAIIRLLVEQSPSP